MTLALHAVLGIALVIGYVVLSVTGHDGSPLLYFLGGQAAGGMIQKGAPSLTIGGVG